MSINRPGNGGGPDVAMGDRKSEPEQAEPRLLQHQIDPAGDIHAMGVDEWAVSFDYHQIVVARTGQ